jgi:hypothetical protein
MNQQKGKVRLYSCGGCGTNIGAQLEEFRDRTEVAFAALDIVYVDTSKSNLHSEIDIKNCYLLDGLDGSGKIRSENHEVIATHIRAILQKFPPADLNIVLHSAAGGSGSVIGPLLTSELLASGVPTVVIAIGSADTVLDATNTLKTLKSYESIARSRKAPVVMTYAQNSQELMREDADANAVSTVMALCVLFSRQNRELDSKDLFNFLRYDLVTSFDPQLVSLTLVEGQQSVENLGNVITVASLAKTQTAATMPVMPEVQYVGYLPDNASEKIMNNVPLHFITSDGVFPEVATRLQKLLSDQERNVAARVPKASVLSKDDNIVGTGLVL